MLSYNQYSSGHGGASKCRLLVESCIINGGYLKQLLQIALLILIPITCYAGDIVDENKDEIINAIIPSHIALINNIIQNPEAASMKNLRILTSPHDETELMFYLNSMTDGTTQNQEKLSDKLEGHIDESIASSEKSILLEHLRLSFLAHNKRAGSKAPIIKITNIRQSQNNHYEFVAEGIFLVNDASGKQTELPTKLTFYTDYSEFAHNKSVYLGEIIVNNKIIYGW